MFLLFALKRDEKLDEENFTSCGHMISYENERKNQTNKNSG
jgi:hypothetical protein